MRPLIYTVCVFLTLTLGIVWLGLASHAALERARDSDIVRQWVVSQYIRKGDNPYELALTILLARYGPNNAAGAGIFAIPREVPPTLASSILPVGPPEATYPPPASGLLAITIGWLQTPEAVLIVWLVVNLLAVIGVARLLHSWLRLPTVQLLSTNLLYIIALLILFSPFYSAVEAGQFAILTLVCLLIAVRRTGSDWMAGLALGVGLVKPSIALPFLIVPMLQGRWKSIVVAVVIQGLAMVGIAWAVQGQPFLLTSQWLAVSQYFLQGMYSIQEVINALGWHMTLQGKIASLATLFLTWGVVYYCRRASEEYIFAFLSVASMLWIYHGPYDFVCVLPALLLLMGWQESSRTTAQVWGETCAWQSSTAGVVCFIVLTLALSPPIYGGDSIGSRILRWGGRIALLYLLAVTARLLFQNRQGRTKKEECRSHLLTISSLPVSV